MPKRTDREPKALTSSADRDVQSTDAGLTIRKELSLEEWRELGRVLAARRDQWQWQVGDWLAYGEERYGEEVSISAASELLGLPEGSLVQYRWVSRRIAEPRRRLGVNYTQYRLVARLPEAEQDRLLTESEQNRWTNTKMQRAARGAEADEEAFGSEHTRIEWRLLNLGSAMGYDVWIARDDRNRTFEGQRLRDIPRMLADFPIQPWHPEASEIAGRIDAVWLKNGQVTHAFEVENTTTIYSGLLRMCDLVSLVSNLDVRLFVVAPEKRRAAVCDEMNRPTFRERTPPLTHRCKLIVFEALEDRLERIGKDIRHLNDSFLGDLSESCEIIEQGR